MRDRIREIRQLLLYEEMETLQTIIEIVEDDTTLTREDIIIYLKGFLRNVQTKEDMSI